MKKIYIYKKIKIKLKNNNLLCNNGMKINNIYKYKKKKNNNIIIYYIPLFQLKLFIKMFISNYKDINKKVVYYFELKLYGLGFKLSRTKKNILRLDLGWSHALLFKMHVDIILIKKKTEMLFYSLKQQKLSNFVVLLKKIYKRSPYHVKGIFNLHEYVKTKLGKQRQR